MELNYKVTKTLEGVKLSMDEARCIYHLLNNLDWGDVCGALDQAHGANQPSSIMGESTLTHLLEDLEIQFDESREGKVDNA